MRHCAPHHLLQHDFSFPPDVLVTQSTSKRFLCFLNPDSQTPPHLVSADFGADVDARRRIIRHRHVRARYRRLVRHHGRLGLEALLNKRLVVDRVSLTFQGLLSMCKEQLALWL